MNNPNIIFIVLDTLRADRVLATYKDINLTPFISSLLSNSIYFENCIANSPWTLPSHISMFTGLYKTQHVLISKKYETLSQKIPVLTEILKNMGYYTICFTENPYISQAYGLTRGFDRIIKNWKPGGYWWWWIEKEDKISKFSNYLNIIDSHLKKIIKPKNLLKIWQIIKFKIDRLIKGIIKYLFWKNLLFTYKNKTINDLVRFSYLLKKNTYNKPFYLYFNIMATHAPYIPIKEAFETFDITDKDFKFIKNFLYNPQKFRIKLNLKSKHASKKKIKIIKKFYNICVLSSDILLKKIFSILKELDLLENSWIIITSDHGEHLCDHLNHNIWGHKTCISVYDTVLRVPLIIYNSNFKKRIIKNQVQLKDLFHTILHLTGNPMKRNRYLDKTKSIINQIDTNSTPKYIFGDYVKEKPNINRLISLANTHRRFSKKRSLIKRIINPIYFLRTNEHKYIKYYKNEEEFFDLLTDPHEQINIINDDNKNYRNLKLYMENLLNTFKNADDLKNIITEKEKDFINKKIRQIKIKGI